MGQPLRLALIGAGRITQHAHLPAALASPRARVVAIVDPAPGRAAELARSHDLRPRLAGRLEEVLSEIDAAVVATPNDTHRTVAVRCLEAGVSVLVEKPLATSSEDGEAMVRAAEKLRQDQMVARACREGLRAVILCPPNVSGPYSPFLQRLTGALGRGTFAMVDGGRRPCNLVDVENLARAIELALERDAPLGRRLFVTDDEQTTWRDVVAALRPLADAADPPAIEAIELARRRDALTALPRLALIRSLAHLISPEVRETVRRDPLVDRAYQAVRRTVAWLSPRAHARIRRAVGRGARTEVDGIDVALSARQLRGVRHSCELATRGLGYRPLHSCADSLEAFGAWYRSSRVLDTEFADLLRQLR